MIKIPLLSKKRWEHCKSVSNYSIDLALRWGVDPIKAGIAGLLHDIAREMLKEDFIPFAKQYHIPITVEDEASPILLHGAVGAVIAKENYGINDEEILAAITKHTLGSATMTTLDKIIYLADSIEPLRDYRGIVLLRALAFENLDEALLLGITQAEQYLETQGIPQNPKTIAMKHNLLKEIKNK